MIALAIFGVQIVFVQYAFSQTVASPAMNNPLPPGFGPNMPGLSPQPTVGPNIGLAPPLLAGPMLPNTIPGPAFGPIGPQALGPNMPMGLMGMPGIAGNSLAGYAGAYGGSGNGEVAVAGELPVVGTTAITGQVPLTGKVQFAGNIPAGGVVTISGQCGCGCNGPYAAPYAAKPAYNKPYLY